MVSQFNHYQMGATAPKPPLNCFKRDGSKSSQNKMADADVAYVDLVSNG